MGNVRCKGEYRLLLRNGCNIEYSCIKSEPLLGNNTRRLSYEKKTTGVFLTPVWIQT